VKISENEWRDLLTQLTERERTAVLARYYEGKAWQTVGKMLGVTTEAARQVGNRAVKKLRGMINGTANERCVIALPKKAEWFGNQYNQWEAIRHFKAFSRRMERVLVVKLRKQWPKGWKYAGPIVVTLPSGEQIWCKGIVEEGVIIK
jgi:hypothetical protein